MGHAARGLEGQEGLLQPGGDAGRGGAAAKASLDGRAGRIWLPHAGSRLARPGLGTRRDPLKPRAWVVGERSGAVRGARGAWARAVGGAYRKEEKRSEREKASGGVESFIPSLWPSPHRQRAPRASSLRAMPGAPQDTAPAAAPAASPPPPPDTASFFPVIDLSPLLSPDPAALWASADAGTASPPVTAACAAIAACLRETGCLLVRDPRAGRSWAGSDRGAECRSPEPDRRGRGKHPARVAESCCR